MANSDEKRGGDGNEGVSEEGIVDEVLKSYGRDDPFACLGLEGPKADSWGRPVWDVREGEIHEKLQAAFKQRALQVHPDKHRGSERANRAFDALKASLETLKDRTKRVR